MQYKNLIEALTIFSKYQHREGVSAEHDILYAGPSPADVSEKDLATLEELGWHPSDEYDGFYAFV